MGKKLDNLLNAGKRVLVRGLIATTGLLPISYITGCYLDNKVAEERKGKSALYGVICSSVIDADKSGKTGDSDEDFTDSGKKYFAPGDPLTIFTTLIRKKGTLIVSILDANQRVVFADTNEIKTNLMSLSNKVYTKVLYTLAGEQPSEYTVVWRMNRVPVERKKFTVAY